MVVADDQALVRSGFAMILSAAGIEVVGEAADGREAIARRSAALYLSEATVKTHVTRIRTELGLRDRVPAVVLAYETGLVQPGG